MNAWNAPEPGTRRARELDELIRQSPAIGGRPKRRTPAGEIQHENQHQRRIAYLRRGGRHGEADIEAAVYAAREDRDQRERILASQIERQRP